jgi:hypothetical protein
MSKMVYRFGEQPPDESPREPQPVRTYVSISTTPVKPKPVEHIVVKYVGGPGAESARKVKRHAWSVTGVVRDAENWVTGVTVLCEHCGE